ncbi:MAG: methyltransferase [Actinomycetota bacterium]|nr:methyltransferase [Actinomycetota bacterium]MDQ2955693.1 methyltransferase [Actinomycetota bacterium]
MSAIPVRPLLPVPVIERLAESVARDYGSVAVAEVLGLAGQAALSRADLAAVDRLSRGGSETETFIRLFLLGLPVPVMAAAAALAPLSIADALAAGLLETAPAPAEELVRAALDVRPYSESGGPDWWVLSDLGADRRPGTLHPEHVLGVGSAATTLAQATVRRPVGRALDVGTGCGIQALHLSRHSDSITATDLSERALSFAASTAALNGQSWELRAGSLLEPVAGERFDLIVCNPPFIVGPGFTPGADGFSYRDSGLAGDSVCAELVGGLPGRLAEGGTAQLLANWIIGQDEPWQDRVAGWLPTTGCDAWVWQREVAEPGEYVSLWLRDAGEQPGTARWQRRYDRWLDWFAASGVLAVGMGLVNIRRTGSDSSRVVCEDVPQAYQQPIGAAVDSWFDRSDWLRDADLLAARLVPVADLVLQTRSLIGAEGWQPALSVLRQSHELRWELEIDEAVSALIAACSTATPLGVLFDLVAAAVQLPADEVTEALVPVVRDLVERGFLVPEAVG